MSKTDYRGEAQRMADEFARNFHAPVVAMNHQDATFTEDTLITFVRSAEDIRNEAQGKIWAEAARIQAEKFATERNLGKRGRVYLTPEEQEIKKQVDEYAERQKRGGGHFPKRY